MADDHCDDEMLARVRDCMVDYYDLFVRVCDRRGMWVAYAHPDSLHEEIMWERTIRSWERSKSP